MEITNFNNDELLVEMETDIAIETFCDMPIFEYEDGNWDEVEVGHVQFYKVKWKLASMKHFDGFCVSRNLKGDISLFNEDKSFFCNIIDIPEIRKMILARIPNEISTNFN